MKEQTPSKPVWWWNTFFWFGFILICLAIWGAISGEDKIRDPGQVKESGLVIFYFLAGVFMLANGWMTHRQNIQAFNELDPAPEKPTKQVTQEEASVSKEEN